MKTVSTFLIPIFITLFCSIHMANALDQLSKEDRDTLIQLDKELDTEHRLNWNVEPDNRNPGDDGRWDLVEWSEGPEARVQELFFPYNLDNNDTVTQLTELERLELWSDANVITNLDILKQFRKLKHLSLTKISPALFADLCELTELEGLSIRSSTISNIDCLSGLKKLRTLSISNSRIQDLSPLRNLEELQELSLSGNPLSNLEPLASLTKLESIWMQNTSIASIHGLQNKPQLSLLALANNNLTSIDALSEYAHFFLLDLTNNNITNIKGLQNISSADIVELSRNNIQDISPLRNLKKVERLYLDDNQINNLNGLCNLQYVNTLLANNNRIESISIFDRDCLMYNLNFRNNMITTLRDFANWGSIQKLDLGNNRICELGMIEDAPNLLELGLENNNITDVSSLSKLSKIERLYLNDNNITDIQALEALTTLYSLHLHNNRITDVKVLHNRKNALIQLTLDGNSIGLDDLYPLMSVHRSIDFGVQYNVKISSLNSLLFTRVHYDLHTVMQMKAETEFQVIREDDTIAEENTDYKWNDTHIIFITPGRYRIRMQNPMVFSKGTIIHSDKNIGNIFPPFEDNAKNPRELYNEDIEDNREILYSFDTENNPKGVRHPLAIIYTELYTVSDSKP